MDANALFSMALGLVKPWTVADLKFDAQQKRLDIHVDFASGSTFGCPECGAACKVHDTAKHEWRHLNFFEHTTVVTARQPRTKCGTHGVKQVEVPWARAGSGFTLLFEAFVLELLRAGMPMAAAARIVGEHDTRLWRVTAFYVARALAELKLKGVAKVGVDETSRARGHNYLSLFVDLELARVIFIALDRDGGTLEQFKTWLEEHGADPKDIREFSLDMSPAYVSGIAESFPNANLTFDKFHVIKLLNEAVDEVRRDEQKNLPDIKKSRFLWLRNSTDLTDEQRARFELVRTIATRTARAYRYREMFQELYRQPDAATARDVFDRWHRSATRSRLPAIRRVARTLKEHAAGVLRWFESKITNGLLEGLSSLVQASKAAARGYRNPNYMATMIYLRMSKLDLRLPQATPSRSI